MAKKKVVIVKVVKSNDNIAAVKREKGPITVEPHIK